MSTTDSSKLHFNTKHGHTAKGKWTPEYRAWSHMIGRCLRKHDKAYCYYGGRGIKVCERWLKSFVAFYEDMGQKPSAKHQLDRIDNNGHYEPGNCRWATVRQQLGNYSKNVLYTFQGQTMCIRDWAEHVGFTYETLYFRLRRGMPIERALTQRPRYE